MNRNSVIFHFCSPSRHLHFFEPQASNNHIPKHHPSAATITVSSDPAARRMKRHERRARAWRLSTKTSSALLMECSGARKALRSVCSRPMPQAATEQSTKIPRRRKRWATRRADQSRRLRFNCAAFGSVRAPSHAHQPSPSCRQVFPDFSNQNYNLQPPACRPCCEVT